MNATIQTYDFRIYTDGGYSMCNNEGAWAFVIVDPTSGEIMNKASGAIRNQTNNIAELTAILEAIRMLPGGCSAQICTDSQYAIGVLSNPSWRPKKNRELILEIKQTWKNKALGLWFCWVRGHSGDKYNELVDSMCDDAVGYDLNAEYMKYKGK